MSYTCGQYGTIITSHFLGRGNQVSLACLPLCRVIFVPLRNELQKGDIMVFGSLNISSFEKKNEVRNAFF